MIEVTVPASSANLGAGFDALGLALTLYNRVWMELADGCYIECATSDASAVDAVPAADIPADEDNLVFAAAKELYARVGTPFAGLHIRQENHIPIARGLGSSSACIVAGLAGANALLGGPLSTAQLVDLATEMEGHPDNVAPAFYGGLVTSAMDGNRVYTVHVPVAEGMRFAVFIPPFELKTSDARAALPETVSRADAVYNLSRAALMTASLFSGDTENLRVAMQDRLHQPYRFPLIPGAPQVMEAAYALGAHGVCVSGAGSSLLAFVTHPGAEDFEIRARAALAGEGLADWGVRILECDKKGVQVREMLN